MKLIIEVTETIYEMCKEWKEVKVSNWSENIIANGVPYSKGKWGYTTHHGRRYRICPNCHAEREDDKTTWYFCPNCGMESEENE